MCSKIVMLTSKEQLARHKTSALLLKFLTAFFLRKNSDKIIRDNL